MRRALNDSTHLNSTQLSGGDSYWGCLGAILEPLGAIKSPRENLKLKANFQKLTLEVGKLTFNVRDSENKDVIQTKKLTLKVGM